MTTETQPRPITAAQFHLELDTATDALAITVGDPITIGWDHDVQGPGWGYLVAGPAQMEFHEQGWNQVLLLVDAGPLSQEIAYPVGPDEMGLAQGCSTCEHPWGGGRYGCHRDD